MDSFVEVSFLKSSPMLWLLASVLLLGIKHFWIFQACPFSKRVYFACLLHDGASGRVGVAGVYKISTHTPAKGSRSNICLLIFIDLGILPVNVIEKMGLLLQTTSSCVSPFIQKAGIEAIKGKQIEVEKMVKEYQKRRDLLVDGLNSIDGISCLNPGGAFYLFANIKETGMTSEQMADFLLDNAGVAVIPGNNFGEFGEGYIRFCFATNQKNIEKAIIKIKESLKKRV